MTSRDDAAADDAVGIDDPRLRHLGHAEGDGDRAVVVVARPASHRPRWRRTSSTLLAVVVVDDRVEAGAVGRAPAAAATNVAELGVLLLARHAARLEEVEHDPVALAPGQVERRRRRPARRRPPAPAGPSAASRPSRRRRLGAGEHDEQPGDHDGDGEGDERGEARRSRISVPASYARSTSRSAPLPPVGRRSAPTPGSVGRRRREPGNAASSVPMAIIAPPIHSHRISGLTNTRIVAAVAPGAAPRSSVR